MIAIAALFETKLCVMSKLYAIENAQVSDMNEVLHLLKCGRLHQDFDKSAVRFPDSDTTLCSSLNSNWFDSPMYESGFGYAIKRQNAEDFNEIGGVICFCTIYIKILL
ncbi:hypothetical protein DPMN_161783 [Dreissena polymorpha]|uniref:Uncharacterized protein n=1 Tax=Dreissena polymorpha TaxID=45954 RepID=A0A9D4EQD1_DREPO|nr:hypothetical protein DPMN_161783 [Dreissena polymorpha]